MDKDIYTWKRSGRRSEPRYTCTINDHALTIIRIDARRWNWYLTKNGEVITDKSFISTLTTAKQQIITAFEKYCLAAKNKQPQWKRGWNNSYFCTDNNLRVTVWYTPSINWSWCIANNKNCFNIETGLRCASEEAAKASALRALALMRPEKSRTVYKIHNSTTDKFFTKIKNPWCVLPEQAHIFHSLEDVEQALSKILDAGFRDSIKVLTYKQQLVNTGSIEYGLVHQYVKGKHEQK